MSNFARRMGKVIVSLVGGLTITGCALKAGKTIDHPDGRREASYVALDLGRDFQAETVGPAYASTLVQNESTTARNAITGAVTYGAAALLADVTKAKDAGDAATAQAGIKGNTATTLGAQETTRNAANQVTAQALAP